MGAMLSKLWGALKGRKGGVKNDSTGAKGQRKAVDLENGLPTTNTPAKPPTPMPSMGIKKYEITEVCEPLFLDVCWMMEGYLSPHIPSSKFPGFPWRNETLLYIIRPLVLHATRAWLMFNCFAAMDPLPLRPRRRSVLGRVDQHPSLHRHPETGATPC